MLSLSILDVQMMPPMDPGRRKSRWTVRVQHGDQLQRTRPIALADNKTDAPASGEASAAGCPPWTETAIEIQDNEGGGDVVEIALSADPTTEGNKKSEMCESIATINLSTFRDQPDERSILWLPLRAVAPDMKESVQAIKVAVTYYSEDYMTHGYMFALFCGLVPYSWAERLALPWCKNNDYKKKAERVQTYIPSSFDEVKLTPIPTVVKAG